MNLEQRVSNLERNSSTAIPGNPTLGRIELINIASTQSLTNATDIVIGASGTAGNQWSIVENSGGLFTLGTSTGLVTVRSTGRYCIYGKIRMDSSTLGTRIFTLLQNSSVGINQNSTTAVGNGNATMAISVPSFRLAANDTLELRIFQNSGAARTFAVASTNPLYFIVEYLGA